MLFKVPGASSSLRLPGMVTSPGFVGCLYCMSTIRLTPYSEELLQKQLMRGPYRSPEEVIERALETLAQKESTSYQPGSAAKSPSEAVADILEIQKRNHLGGLKIKDLIHEGHKY
jgi:Arc/MetJ-type ribon-helix-helix transcriptional regulator